MSDYSRSRRETEEPEGYFCRFTFGQFFALLVLEVFTLFFVFYLGARYGREFLGLDRSTPNVIVGKAETSSAGGKVLTTGDAEAKAIAQDMIAKAQTPELKERIAEMLKKDGVGSVPQASARPVQEAVPSQTAPQMVTPPTPSAEVPINQPSTEEPAVAATEPPADVSAKGPQSLPFRAPQASDQENTSMIRVKSADNARFSIQVGSYQSLAEANGIIDRWKGKGYPAYMMIADIPDKGRWYRVRLGGFNTKADASKYLNELSAKENVSGAMIVLNEQ